MVLERARDTLDHMIGSRERGQSVDIIHQEGTLDVHDSFITWADRDGDALTVSSTAVQISEQQRDFTHAFIIVESARVRFWIDGSIPTATVGFPADVGDIIELFGREELNRFKVIRRDGTDAALRVTVGNRTDE